MTDCDEVKVLAIGHADFA